MFLATPVKSLFVEKVCVWLYFRDSTLLRSLLFPTQNDDGSISHYWVFHHDVGDRRV